MANLNVKITKNYKLPVESGSYHRLVCLTGKNKGLSYFLIGKRVVLGRSEKSDIQVYDSKSSREHAELTLVKNKFVVTDLGSQNGIIVNELKVKQHSFEENDKLVIGSTIYKYNVVEVKKENFEDADHEEEDETFEEDADSSEQQGGKKKNKRLVIIMVALMAVVFLLPDDSKKQTKVRNSKRVKESSISRYVRKNAQGEDKELNKKVKNIIKRGQREFREGNYFRAIEEFNMALMNDPENGNAHFYLAKTKQRLDEQIRQYENKGKQEVDSLKYRGALVSYCSILSLIRDYPDDSRYINAKTQIDFIQEKLGYKSGEYKCF